MDSHLMAALKVNAILGVGMLVLMYVFGMSYDDIFYYSLFLTPLFWF